MLPRLRHEVGEGELGQDGVVKRGVDLNLVDNHGPAGADNAGGCNRVAFVLVGHHVAGNGHGQRYNTFRCELHGVPGTRQISQAEQCRGGEHAARLHDRLVQRHADLDVLLVTRDGVEAQGLHDVLDALGIEKTWIVGNSLGGWVGFQMIIDHPERVKGIISMGTGGAKLTGALKGHSNPELSEAGIRNTLEQFVVNKSLITDELVSLRYQSALNDTASDRLQQVVQARDRDRTELPLDFDVLAKVEIPVLLVHGMQDIVITPQRTWDLVNTIPSADAHLFAQCGHWSQVEKAEEFNELIVNWIQRQFA